MSTNFYLRQHVYKGSECNEEFPFHEINVIELPLRLCIDTDHRLLHVCKTTSERVLWVMTPPHVQILLDKYPNEPVLVDEFNEEWTGDEFAKYIENMVYVYKIGEYFC